MDKEKVKKVWHSSATLIIGKNGWESIIEEFKKQIKKRKIIKVKLLKSARTLPTKEIAENIANRTGSKIVGIRGNQIVFYKEEKVKN